MRIRRSGPGAARRRSEPAGAVIPAALATLAAVLALMGESAVAATVGAGRLPAAPAPVTALLTTPHVVVDRLGRTPAGALVVSASRPVTGVQTALPIVGRGRAADGARLLYVMLPGRPNGALGWIRQAGTTIHRSDWSLSIDTSAREVLVYRRGVLARSLGVVVGKPATPTPLGEFFVEESVRMIPGAAGGPYALALSARSEVLQTFGGGPGQIAIHGVANLAGAIGSASSHGCVRLSARDIAWLARRIAPGTRVSVVA